MAVQITYFLFYNSDISTLKYILNVYESTDFSSLKFNNDNENVAEYTVDDTAYLARLFLENSSKGDQAPSPNKSSGDYSVLASSSSNGFSVSLEDFQTGFGNTTGGVPSSSSSTATSGVNNNISFTDVAPTDWFYPHVMAMVNSGVINGRGDGSYDPRGSLTVRHTCN